MEEMEETKSVTERFVEAWQACQNPPLDGENPHYRNRYATLKSTLAEVRKACAASRIAYVQELRLVDGMWLLCSRITDGAQSHDLSQFPVATGGNAQQLGSEMTYKKRQQAQADWGIVGEEDDDAEQAVTATAQAPTRHGNPQPAGVRAATEKQLGMLRKLMAPETEQAVCSNYGVPSLEQLSVAQASDVISQLRGQ